MAMKSINVSMGKVAEQLIHVMKCGLVPMMYGAPGEGKSAVAQQIADHFKLLLIDIRLAAYEPVDLNGVLSLNEDKTRGRYVAMEEIPLDGDEIPVNPATGKPYNGYLLMLDELTSAADDTKAAAYKLILDKKVGQKAIHKKIWMMAAGNREDDGAIAGALGTALGSRLINFTVRADVTHWISIMSATHDPRIIAFLNYNKDAFNKFDPTSDEYTHPCARTWSHLSKLITPLKELKGWSAMIAGTIGVSMAREFETFVTYFGKVVTIEEIETNPEHATIPTSEPSWMYALVGVLIRGVSVKNVKECMTFIERMPMTYQIIALRSIIKRTPAVATNKEISDWCVKHADELF